MTKAETIAWRSNQKALKNAKKIVILKKYAKLCKKEGIVSDRVRIGKHEPNSSSEGHERPQVSSKKPSQSKPQPPASAVSPPEEVKVDKLELLKEAKAKERKQQHKIMTMKTKTGQPVMAGRIKNILSKLTQESNNK